MFEQAKTCSPITVFFSKHENCSVDETDSSDNIDILQLSSFIQEKNDACISSEDMQHQTEFITNNEAENNENNDVDVEEVAVCDVLQINKLQPSTNIESDLPSEVDALSNIEESQKMDSPLHHESTDVSNPLPDDKLEICLFSRPKAGEIESFFKYHPQQNISDSVIKKAFIRKDGSNRIWLSYDEVSKALFCTVCLAFAHDSENNKFINGMSERRHVHQRVEEHEVNECHRRCAEAYLLRNSKAGIKNLLFFNQLNAREQQVKKRRMIMQRIINIMKVIGKRGLSVRGDLNETAYTLQNKFLDHGNFLEIMILLSKYDMVLHEHINECIQKSQKNEEEKVKHRSKEDKLKDKKGPKGRGNFVTLFSKTTLNSVIDTIGNEIKKVVAKEVKEAGMFSVQIDTTQDVSCHDQCSIVVRYVLNDKVNEKLLAIVRCHSTTGEDLQNVLMNVLHATDIDIKICIGSSTDGAANMQGQYKGFSAKLSAEAPHQVHVWCYAHVLNLVLSDTTSSVISSASLFSLLNDVAVFLKSSYLRMDKWENIAQDPHHRRLNLIGETRWWSKSNAVNKVFGTLDKKESSMYVMYVIVIATLHAIENGDQFAPDTRVKAKSYKEALLKYETVLTAFIFLYIYKETTPLSKYLQTSGFDILKAYKMVQVTTEKLDQIRENFSGVKDKADNFVNWSSMQFDDKNLEVEAETELPQKRIRKKRTCQEKVLQTKLYRIL